MSFSREIKDFVGAFQVGAKLWKDSEYSAARAKYFNAQTEKLANPDPLDQKIKELRVQDADARIQLTRARIGAVGRQRAGGGAGAGGASPALRDFLRQHGDNAEVEDEDDEVGTAPAQTSALDLGPQPTTFAASGGMIDSDEQSHGEYWQEEYARAQSAGEPTPAQPLASLGEAIGSGLKFLQRSFGLDQDSAALPGTDPQRQQRVEAMMRGAGAPSDDEMRMVRKTVDPSGEINDGVANATAVERAYDFHKGRGDTQAAEKVSAQFLQYYRGQAAKLGALAQEALNNRDMDGAINAAVAGFNQMPNGSVAKREGDKLIITDYKSGQPVEEIPLTPGLVAEAAKGLMDGSTFFSFMAQAAGKGGGAPGGAPPTEGASVAPAAQPTGALPTGAPSAEGASVAPAAQPAGALPTGAPPPAAAQPAGALPTGAPPAEGASAAPAALPGVTRARGGSAPPKGLQKLFSIEQALATDGITKGDIAFLEKTNKERAAANAIILREHREAQRHASTQDRLDQRTLASSALEDQRNANMAERNEKSQMRLEQYRTMRPRDFDTSNHENVKEVENFVYEAAAQGSDGRVTPAVMKKEFGVQGVRRLRDATIDLHRYNLSMPLDTAAAVAHYLAQPITAETTSRDDVDNAPNAAPYTVTRLQGIPGIENGSPRVVITANNRDFPDIVLPASTMQQLDILRGQRTQALYASEVGKAEKELSKNKRGNALVDARREAGIERDARDTESYRRAPGGVLRAPRMRGIDITDQFGGR